MTIFPVYIGQNVEWTAVKLPAVGAATYYWESNDAWSIQYSEVEQHVISNAYFDEKLTFFLSCSYTKYSFSEVLLSTENPLQSDLRIPSVQDYF